MSREPQTYFCKQVSIVFGNHIVTGWADDNFVAYEKNGDGTTTKFGCDGEIVRSIDPDTSYKIDLSLLHTSRTNAFLQNKYNQDQITGDGYFPLMIKDLRGTVLLQADYAWVAKPAGRGFGKEAPNTEWEIQTGEATIVEGG